ncbi:MAG: lytic transglycosylase domain-containing protein [Pseudomonadaceae bacterium]|nr:lytic transglycosylase domain-containing protein [Pseudomonadaceae bacterium]
MSRQLKPILLFFACMSFAPHGFTTTIEVDPVLRERLAQNMAEVHEHIDRFDAQVWLQVSDQRLQRYLPKQADRLELLKLVYTEATRQSLNPNLVLAVMQIESAFNRFAISSVGAQGLMQVMPFWRLEIGRAQDNLINTETNIRYGTVILAHYIEVAKGDLVDALARYNGSRGRLKYPEKVIGAWRKTWRNQPWSELPLLRASCANYPLRACRYQ